MRFVIGLAICVVIMWGHGQQVQAAVKYPPTAKTLFEKIDYCLNRLSAELSVDEVELEYSPELVQAREIGVKHYTFINSMTPEYYSKYYPLQSRQFKRSELIGELRENIDLLIRKDHMQARAKHLGKLGELAPEKKEQVLNTLNAYWAMESVCALGAQAGLLRRYYFPEIGGYIADTLASGNEIDKAKIAQLESEGKEFSPGITDRFKKACASISRMETFAKMLKDSSPENSDKVDLSCGWTVSGINMQDWKRGDGKYVKVVGEIEHNVGGVTPSQEFLVKVYGRAYKPIEQGSFWGTVPKGKSQIFKVEIMGYESSDVGAINIDCAN